MSEQADILVRMSGELVLNSSFGRSAASLSLGPGRSRVAVGVNRSFAEGWETLAPVRLGHHRVVLDDGHNVGVSIGGRGVPLVFLHGFSLNRHVYLRLLSRIGALGFRVFAIDAAGHGETARLPKDACSFTQRVDLTARTLDAIGVRTAILMGHSMGGRMTIEFAAARPHRVIAAVLLDAAGGTHFDSLAIQAVARPPSAMRPLLNALIDTEADRRLVSTYDRSHYRRTLTRAVGQTVLHPVHAIGAARSIAASQRTGPLLHKMRDNKVHTIVVHGESDTIVPWASAVSMAESANGALYKVPGAHHSWMIADPQRGADAVAQLVRAELGEAIREAQTRLCIRRSHPDAWEAATLTHGRLAHPQSGQTI